MKNTVKFSALTLAASAATLNYEEPKTYEIPQSINPRKIKYKDLWDNLYKA